jgi:pantoate--beta-alanine ligase
MYLSDDDRAVALSLSAALYAGATRAAAGAEQVLAAASAVLHDVPGVEVDYLRLVDDETWKPAGPVATSGRLLVAARLGSTRLIDNVPVPLAAGAPDRTEEAPCS